MIEFRAFEFGDGRKKRFGLDYTDAAGKRHRPGFESERAREAGKVEIIRADAVGGAVAVSGGDLVELRRCREILGPGVTLLEACLAYAAGRADFKPMEIGQAAELFGWRREQMGVSAGRIRSGAAVFEALRGGFGGNVGAISERRLAAWLLALPLAPDTVRSYRAHLKSFFDFCAAEGWCRPLDFGAVPTVRIVEKEAKILAVDEVAALMAHVWAEHPIFAGVFALGFFGGLRTSSALRLVMADINFEERGILLPAASHKTRKRHYVDCFDPALWVWLEAVRERVGAAAFKISPREWNRRRAEIAREVGVTIPHNGLRKSYASYALAARADASWVATTLTHRNPSKLYQVYKGNARRADGLAFFEILPPKK